MTHSEAPAADGSAELTGLLGDGLGRRLGLDTARLNVHGGACALGHPIGASGARILATLLSALQTTGQRRGLASLCIGGGEATAMAVELMQ